MDGERKGWKGRAEEETLDPPSLLDDGEPATILAGSAEEGGEERLRVGEERLRAGEECVRECVAVVDGELGTRGARFRYSGVWEQFSWAVLGLAGLAAMKITQI